MWQLLGVFEAMVTTVQGKSQLKASTAFRKQRAQLSVARLPRAFLGLPRATGSEDSQQAKPLSGQVCTRQQHALVPGSSPETRFEGFLLFPGYLHEDRISRGWPQPP